MIHSKIQHWIEDFSAKPQVSDSYHIDELLSHSVPKKEWISKAFDLYSLCAQYNPNNKISIELCFELNRTILKCPIPRKLSRQCFNRTNTPPEIYLHKGDSTSLFPDNGIYVPKLSELYKMSVYYFEKAEDVYYRWIFFTR